MKELRLSFRIIMYIMSGLLVVSCAGRKQQQRHHNAQQLLGEPVKLWNDVPRTSLDCNDKVFPVKFRLLEADTALLASVLVRQGISAGALNTDTISIELPKPEGGWEFFRIWQVEVMPPPLAARYPHIKSYAGTDPLKPEHHVRLETSGGQVRAMVTYPGGTWFIDPYCQYDSVHVISFYKKDVPEGVKIDFER